MIGDLMSGTDKYHDVTVIGAGVGSFGKVTVAGAYTTATMIHCSGVVSMPERGSKHE